MKATLPPTLTVPELRAKTPWFAADWPELYKALTVRFPETDKFEIVEVSVAVKSLFASVGVVVPPTVSAAQLIVPAPWITTAVLAAAAFRLVIPAVAVKVTPELTVRVAVLALLLLNVIELTVAPAVTVTEAPARMTAASVLAGTTPPAQVVVAFQLPPDAVEIRVAPRLASAPSRVTAVASVTDRSLFTGFLKSVRLLSSPAFQFQIQFFTNRTTVRSGRQHFLKHS